MNDDGSCPAPAGALGPGAMVLVVGPSGAGKDTLIAEARRRFAGDDRFVFVRRIVTRVPAPRSEDHEALSPERFVQAERGGAFALAWRAHGLAYALPASCDAEIAAGRIVVANVSREAIGAARRRYALCSVVHVTASREILRERLAARGREEPAEIEARIARAEHPPAAGAGNVTVLDNGGCLDDVAGRFTNLLAALAGHLAPAR